MYDAERDMRIIAEFRGNLNADVPAAVRALGITYREEQMPLGYSNIIDLGILGPSIVVNSAQGPLKRRFSAAHALGHYILHQEELAGKIHVDRVFDPGRFRTRELPIEVEQQASNFAEDLIMPWEICSERYQANPEGYISLAEDCGVPAQIMQARLKVIGVWNDDLHRSHGSGPEMY